MITEEQYQSFKSRIVEVKEKLSEKLSGNKEDLELLNDLFDIAELSINGYHQCSKKLAELQNPE